jgi:hypothetical protein
MGYEYARQNDRDIYPIVVGGTFVALWISAAPDRRCQA